MLNTSDVLETIRMIQDQNLDIRTITMGISLLDCADGSIERSCEKVYDKIARCAKDLVKTGEALEMEYGIPIINKRISVTPIAMLAAASGGDPVQYALALERAACEVGVNFIGGFSALVHKGFAAGDEALINAIPEALKSTDHVCASVNIGSTKTGINLDAVGLMGRIVRRCAEVTADNNCFAAAKLVVFCNAPEDNPFMAGAFHGAGEPDCVINVGASTISTCMYYTGYDCRTMEPVYVPVSPHEKAMQRALIQYRNPKNHDLVAEALKIAGRTDLIGFDKKCLIRPRGSRGLEGQEGRTGRHASSNRPKKTIRNVHKKKGS